MIYSHPSSQLLNTPNLKKSLRLQLRHRIFQSCIPFRCYPKGFDFIHFLFRESIPTILPFLVSGVSHIKPSYSTFVLPATLRAFGYGFSAYLQVDLLHQTVQALRAFTAPVHLAVPELRTFSL